MRVSWVPETKLDEIVLGLLKKLRRSDETNVLLSIRPFGDVIGGGLDSWALCAGTGIMHRV
eukprot:8880146-Pyramimonas_sp.AAC.1